MERLPIRGWGFEDFSLLFIEKFFFGDAGSRYKYGRSLG
jgi:hypothetical protein